MSVLNLLILPPDSMMAARIDQKQNAYLPWRPRAHTRAHVSTSAPLEGL